MAQGDSSASARVQVNMVAVQALNEGRETQYFDPALLGIRQSIQGLDYDTFREVRTTNQSLKYDKETKITINERYTLCLKPVKKDDHGRIRVQARIEMAPRREGDAAINALSDTTLLMMPGKKLNLGGLKLEKGDLIVVLWFDE